MYHHLSLYIFFFLSLPHRSPSLQPLFLPDVPFFYPSSSILLCYPITVFLSTFVLSQGQVFILDSLSSYTPLDSREAEGIIERVAPRLQHANSAVVMSAVRIILKYMDEITSQDTIRVFSKKLTPPLVTLLNSEPEIQYVALRNINLIVQKRPKILEHEIKVFFCKYNDPIYVKVEKLEIVIRLASINNIDQVRVKGNHFLA